MATYNYVNLIDSRFITISGDDRKDYLQGIITNDINKCTSDNALYSCLLSPQGKFIADFFIIEYQNKYLLEINNKFIEDFLKKLKIYKLRSNVNINKNDIYRSFVILDNDVTKFENNILTFIDPRSEKLGIKAYIEYQKMSIIINKFNLNEINFSVYRELLINNLIPYSTEDLIVNKSLLLENNFDNINAIDWEKGCYVGQEITARMKYRALLKKSIKALEIISGNTEPGNKIYYNKNEVGEIISCFNNFAIGMLKIEDAKDIFRNKRIVKTEFANLKIIK